MRPHTLSGMANSSSYHYHITLLSFFSLDYETATPLMSYSTFSTFFISESIQLCNILAMFSHGKKRLHKEKWIKLVIFSGHRLVKYHKKICF